MLVDWIARPQLVTHTGMEDFMSGATHSLVVLGGLLQAPGAEALFGSWISVTGLVLGAGLFFAWQRRPTTSWGAPRTTAAAVPSYKKSLPLLGQELARMRRYERGLAVLVVGVDRRTQDAEGGNSGRNGRETSYAFWHIGAMLRDLLRNSDIVTSDPAADRFIVLLPESNRAQAQQTANRLRSTLQSATQLRVRMGMAEFPADGLIIEELVKAAAGEVTVSSMPQSIAAGRDG